MIKKLGLVAGAALLAFAGAAGAANSSARLTADNGYWLYTGNASGSDLQLVGSGSSWPAANSYNFNTSPGDYLYVMAIDFGQPHSWQGVFTTPTGTVYSNATSWVAEATTGTTVNAAVIAAATWSAVASDLSASSAPWGNVVGDANAHWIWSSSPSSNDMTVLFRTVAPVDAVTAVPEPGAPAMLLAGLALLPFVARRRRAGSSKS